MAKLVLKLSLALLALPLMLSGSPVHAKDATMIVLEVSGDPGATFSGDCWLYTKFGPEKRYRVNGTVPAKFWLPGVTARCNLEKANIVSRLAAEIIRNDVVEFQQISPPPLRWLAISSTGPWGEARGIASASRPLWQ